MPYYNLLKKEIKSYQRKHRKGKTIDQKQNYCIQCYPVKSISADNYTRRDEIASNAQPNILVSITTRIIQSIKFRQITTPLLELSFYYINYLNQQTDLRIYLPIYKNESYFDGVFGNNGVDWKNSLTAIHTAAQATNTALTTLQTATANRATKIIEVPPFYGRDDEDPYEWIQAFLQAHTTNGWANDRKVALAAGPS
ncbi:unnamed protein product [Rhizophagus irregularis]|nr:unnamed protein product [Rhizophagus irregularis]